MEQTSFELTSTQKSLLATLARETGKPISVLVDEALEVLQAREHGQHEAPAPPVVTPKPIWEIFEEASQAIPEEELARLPTDLAAQVDHYIYGLPKR